MHDTSLFYCATLPCKQFQLVTSSFREKSGCFLENQDFLKITE